MKFTDGYWQMRAGLTAHFPEQVYEVDVEPDGLTVYAPTRRLTHRGDTLNAPMVSVRVSSPMHNVGRIEIQHHKGRRRSKPTFELEPLTAPAITIDDDAQAATLASGDLTVRVEKVGDWRVDFTAGGRLLTTSGRHGVGLIDTEQGPYIHEQLALGVGECVYGLGERFTPFVKNGQVVDLWNEDGGTSSEPAYKNVPVLCHQPRLRRVRQPPGARLI